VWTQGYQISEEIKAFGKHILTFKKLECHLVMLPILNSSKEIQENSGFSMGIDINPTLKQSLMKVLEF
jgi:hypothetical protein